jgi:hypothetical protein
MRHNRSLVAFAASLVLAGCGGSASTSTPQTASALASEGQIALTGIELAESLYFLESGATPSLQATATAANNAAQAAITSFASSGTGTGTLVADLQTAFAGLQAIDAAYATLSTKDAARAKTFSLYLGLAQNSVSTVLSAALSVT